MLYLHLHLQFSVLIWQTPLYKVGIQVRQDAIVVNRVEKFSAEMLVLRYAGYVKASQAPNNVYI